MATNTELDPIFRQALRLLHSPNTDAAENIRKALDDIIKQRHGPSKMLINTLSKKFLAEESKATGSGVVKSVAPVRRQSHKSSDSSSSNSDSSPVQIIASGNVKGSTSTTTSATVLTTDSSGQQQEIPVIISLPDSSDDATIAGVDDDAMDDNMQHLKDLEDLVCVVCRRIDLSAKNRLIECTKCNSLYHQDCHEPQIVDADLSDDQESLWCCAACKTRSHKPAAIQFVSSPAKSTSSSSSSSSKKEKEHSSSSSSGKSKNSSASRHHHHHHHSSHHSKYERSGSLSGNGGSGNSSSSGSKNPVTPNIHIICADKRLQNMKKKAAKSHESKRKRQ